MNAAVNTIVFPIEKVKALRAYYRQCSAGMKGRAEWNDYETAAKLCEQLLTLMVGTEAPASKAKKKGEGAGNA
jgi:hypothetical protein